MKQRAGSCVAFALLAGSIPAIAYGQTATYHLHKEGSRTPGLFQLKVAAPDTNAASAVADMKNQPVNEYLVKAFDTQAGVPSATGTIPAGSIVSFRVWMRKTVNAGTMYPRAKVKLNSATGPSLCAATGTNAITTTITTYSLNCTTATNIPMAAADRFYLWVGINLTASGGGTSVKAELDIEGVLNGHYDSQVVIPLPILPPAISSLSL